MAVITLSLPHGALGAVICDCGISRAASLVVVVHDDVLHNLQTISRAHCQKDKSAVAGLSLIVGTSMCS